MLIMTACADSELPKGEVSSALSTIDTAQPVSEDFPDGYDTIGGTWKVGGIYYRDKLIDINDNEALQSMYKTTMITFNEDGSFVYLKKFNDRGIWTKKEGSKYDYILKTESVFRYDLQQGTLVEKALETENLKQYIITLLDDNSFILSEYDYIMGKAKSDDSPYIFVKEGASSQYIKDNKTPLRNEGDTHSDKKEQASEHDINQSSNASAGERDALAKALQYLGYTAFSYSSLIEQLEYEGYSHSESVYAADHCGASWEEQAEKKAASYLDYSAFSYSGLIDQLKYEGFTSSEAQYGADHCGADWNKQAAQKAQEYMEFTSMSRSELIDQLLFEGFTQSQAEYGANHAY